MNTLKTLVLTLAIALGVSTCFAQSSSFSVTPTASGKYTSQPIKLPPGLKLAGTAGGAVTNLGLGWSTVVSTTNILQAWNITNSTFTYTTNITFTTNTTYADVNAQNIRDLAFQFEFDVNGAATTTSNCIVTLAPNVGGANFATTGEGTFNVTNAAVAGGRSVATFPIPAGIVNAGNWRITQLKWDNVTTTDFLSNSAASFGGHTF